MCCRSHPYMASDLDLQRSWNCLLLYQILRGDYVQYEETHRHDSHDSHSCRISCGLLQSKCYCTDHYDRKVSSSWLFSDILNRNVQKLAVRVPNYASHWIDQSLQRDHVNYYIGPTFPTTPFVAVVGCHFGHYSTLAPSKTSKKIFASTLRGWVGKVLNMNTAYILSGYLMF